MGVMKMIQSEGPSPLLVSLQQLYAAQLAGLQVSPGATKTSVLQGALTTRASSPTVPKSHKSSSSPAGSMKVSHSTPSHTNTHICT